MTIADEERAAFLCDLIELQPEIPLPDDKRDAESRIIERYNTLSAALEALRAEVYDYAEEFRNPHGEPDVKQLIKEAGFSYRAWREGRPFSPAQERRGSR